MKILFVLHHGGAFRLLESVVRHLHSKGHVLTLLYGLKSEFESADRGIQACSSELSDISTGPLKHRQRFRGLANLRELRNCLTYLGAAHPNHLLFKRFGYTVHRPVWRTVKKLLERPYGPKLLTSALMQGLFTKIEQRIPADAAILDWLRRHRPDVVVATPFIFPESAELEYVKAAQALKIPTIVPVLSWDNLTTKGTFHTYPDRTLVWNKALAQEAVALHGVPAHTIECTGAPGFDAWFDMQPTDDRETFCRSIGADPTRPLLLYLCSSSFIAGDETTSILNFAQKLNQNPNTRDITLFVRPHPLNAGIWRDVDAANIVIWPREGDNTDVPRAKQDYFHSIFYSMAVIGLNTSAFLDAAIIDRPCITVMTDQYAARQEGLAHFSHLLDGGFLEVAHGDREAVDIIEAIHIDRDRMKSKRREFVASFVRPKGIHRPAAEVMAEMIEGITRNRRVAAQRHHRN